MRERRGCARSTSMRRGGATSRRTWPLRAAALLALWGGRTGDTDRKVAMVVLLPDGALVVTWRSTARSSEFRASRTCFRLPTACSGPARPDGHSFHRPGHRPWLRHAAWRRRLPARDARAAGAAVETDRRLRIRARRGRRRCTKFRRPGACRHHRAGHFRFSIVGEKVLRLEQRLGYVHKGIERRFTELPILAGHRLAPACRAIRPSLSRGLLPGARGMAGVHIPRARHGCGHSRSSSSAAPITSATSARWATMQGLPSACRSSCASRKAGCVPPNGRWASATFSIRRPGWHECRPAGRQCGDAQPGCADARRRGA